MEHRFKARVCLIVLSASQEMASDELIYLKFLRADMFERGVKTFLILIGSFNREESSWKSMESRL